MEDILQDAQRHLRLALPLMTKLNIPVTPENYMVWYKYVAGLDVALSKAVDALVRDGSEFSAEKNEELYRTFCQNEGDEELIQEIRNSLQQIFAAVATELTEAGGQAAEYESLVSSTMDRLSDNPSVAAIRQATGEIVHATKALGDRGRVIRLRLDESTKSFDVLEKKLLEAKTESSIDFLTGIPNRRFLDETLASLTRQSPSDLSVLLVDIDHFKEFNDKHGHLTGDNVLRFVAKMIKKNVKGKDIVCRFGGEEFAVILPETVPNGALSVAENIRRYFAETPLKAATDAKHLGMLTVSIGAASYRAGESPKDFLRRADLALYHAKNTGRNRVASTAQLKHGVGDPGH